MIHFLPLLLVIALCSVLLWRWQRGHEELRKEMNDGSRTNPDPIPHSDPDAARAEEARVGPG